MHAPLETAAGFGEAASVNVAQVSTRMHNNVLDITAWPLPHQQQVARSKRHIAELMRDAACEASVELARERGAFPLFNADLYLTSTTFASRLPQALRDRVRAHGLRNPRLLLIVPAGTISLAFADGASNGIEPAISWSYTRKSCARRPTKRWWRRLALERLPAPVLSSLRWPAGPSCLSALAKALSRAR